MAPDLSPLPLRAATAAALLLALSGCGPQTDPLVKEGLWHPIHANRANLTMEVANPADLVRGQAATGGTDGEMAAAAVERLRADKLKPLPAADIGPVKATQSGANNGGS